MTLSEAARSSRALKDVADCWDEFLKQPACPLDWLTTPAQAPSARHAHGFVRHSLYKKPRNLLLRPHPASCQTAVIVFTRQPTLRVMLLHPQPVTTRSLMAGCL